jgi:hypothetical protein
MQLLFALITICLSSFAQENLSWLQIGSLVLHPELTHLSRDAGLALTDNKTESSQPIAEKFNDLEARKTWFRILHQSHVPSKDGRFMQISPESIRKLQLIGSTDPEDTNSLLNVIPTQTIFGQAYTAQRLAQPSSDIEKIQATQSTIRLFADNSAAYSQCNQELHEIKLNQNKLVRAFKDREGEAQSYIDAYSGIISPKWKQNKKVVWLSKIGTSTVAVALCKGFMDAITLLIPITAYRNRYTQELQLVGFEQESITEILRIMAPGAFHVAMACCGASIGIFLNEWLLKHLNQQKQLYFKSLAEEVIAAQTVIKQIKNLQTTLETLLPSSQLSGPLHHIKNLFKNSSPQFQKLMDKLKTDPFHTKTSLLWRQADVLVAHALIQEHKQEFINAFKAIGELDAHVAASSLLNPQNPSEGHNASEQNKRPFCLVDLQQREKPFIKLKQFWNPLIPATAPVAKNDITLGEPHTTMIITGPNGTGKTVTEKAVALNAVLAGFGIAAAEEASMTPLTRIQTYLNPTDNMPKKLSTFMAEHAKMDGLVQDIQQAAPSEKILTIIDEPVKGTVEQTGGKLVTEKARRMTRDNHLLLLATHFQRPTELAQEKPQEVTNAYLETTMSDHKTFERTYHLKSGNHPWWFTNDQMRNTFTDWLTQRQ